MRKTNGMGLVYFTPSFDRFSSTLYISPWKFSLSFVNYFPITSGKSGDHRVPLWESII
jgi:hypothetical protein